MLFFFSALCICWVPAIYRPISHPIWRSYIELIAYTYTINFEILLNIIIIKLKEIFDKVRHGFNNSAEVWNKGLTVDYTIFTTDKGNITYQ